MNEEKRTGVGLYFFEGGASGREDFNVALRDLQGVEVKEAEDVEEVEEKDEAKSRGKFAASGRRWRAAGLNDCGRGLHGGGAIGPFVGSD